MASIPPQGQPQFSNQQGFPTPPTQGMSKPVKYGLFGCLGLIVLLVACGLVGGILSALNPNSNGTATNQPTSSPASERAASSPALSASPSPTPQKSLEYMLASINKGYPVDDDDISVKRFRFLLDSLEKKTTNTRQQIADYTVNTQNIAREKYGKEIKLIDLMEQANKAIPYGQKMDYNEIVVLTMVLMVNE